MPEPQGLVFYGGISPEIVVRANYTETHGITPSAAVVEIVPQERVPSEVSDLVLSFGPQTRTYPKCKLDSVRLRIGARQTLSLRILDRRWLWQTGEISGSYNVRSSDETLVSRLERTPQQLATLLLKAMGESRFDVGQLPNLARPEVRWVASNPAKELQSLCSSLGCRVVGGPVGRVRIVRTGKGRPLPSNKNVVSVDNGADPPNLPDSIKLVCGPTRFEAVWTLTAVGEDTDGSVKAIDDLSYKPADGWENEPISMINVKEENDKTAQSLALKSVWKWYQISSTPGEPFADILRDEGVTPILKRKMCLPLESGLTTTRTSEDSATEQEDVEVTGIYWDGESFTPGNVSNTANVTVPYEGEFNLNTERGIVEFADPVRQLDDSGLTHAAADMRLKVAFPIAVDDKDHRFFVERRVATRPRGTGPLVIRRDDLQLTIRATYTSATDFTKGNRVTNESDVVREANYYINAKLEEFQNITTHTVSYTGLQQITLDGAVQQVSYTISDSGMMTTASRNTEHERGTVLPFERAREIEEQRKESDVSIGRLLRNKPVSKAIKQLLLLPDP